MLKTINILNNHIADNDLGSTERENDSITLPTLLLSNLNAYSTQIAVADHLDSLNYTNAVLYSLRIAAALRRHGVSRNDCVGLFIDTSTDLVLGTWGILFSGAAYLPLATDYPQDRLAYMIRDARAKFVLCNNHSYTRLAGLLLPGVAICNIDEIQIANHDEVDALLTNIYQKDGGDIAYVIYTSGTTGKPKGVAISHQAIVNQMRWISKCKYLSSGDRILQKTPISFDAAQWELLGMCCGASVIAAEPGSYRDPEGLIRQIKQHNVSTLQGVPTLLQALGELEEFSTCISLRKIFSGGEALSNKLARHLLKILPGIRLVNLYGPTECTINSTHFEVTHSNIQDTWDVMPIGTPVDGLSCHVLSDDMVPVATGDVGELYISGKQLANGYLFQPEQTEEKFADISLTETLEPMRMYRTGDLVRIDSAGMLHFIGRVDNQVKFRGYRIELDEIRLAIENHDWVKAAAVFISENIHSGHAQLIAAVELNPTEARLMDQGKAESHHQTKSTRVQVKAQLAGRGFRQPDSLAMLPRLTLEGRQETAEQRETVFARKTYRFFNGGAMMQAELMNLLAQNPISEKVIALQELNSSLIGVMLRYLGQFSSDERLLPKFGYASPGALYAVQTYPEIVGIEGIEDGIYYYHPVQHSLYRIADSESSAQESTLRIHFIGNIPAIREIYKNNIYEVLEMECGHILGLLEYVLPQFGLDVGLGHFKEEMQQKLQCPGECAYLGSFDIVSQDQSINDLSIDTYVQVHQDKVEGLSQGTYRYRGRKLQLISEFIIEQRHVIAINQQVYQRASGGISFVSRSDEEWRQYIDLGRSLQRLQMNRIGIGTMSSGYSSKTGNPLATSLRLNDIVSAANEPIGPSYFCLFGKITAEQSCHEGMNEDAVHMMGPAELIRADLFNLLPEYMVPGRIFIVNKMPLSASGKVDVNSIKQQPEFVHSERLRPFVAACSASEEAISRIWCRVLSLESVSMEDDFFELGGNSLQAVAIMRAINHEFGIKLPIQLIFNAPTIRRLADAIDQEDRSSNRAVQLSGSSGVPVFCWPGLGGYPMNLRGLGEAIAGNARFFGIQASGINTGEAAFKSIGAMAAADITLIKNIQPDGPYRLWGYSFGARVAYESAWQLQQRGEVVSELVLLAPGSPKLPYPEPVSRSEKDLYTNQAFLTILLSVFSHDIDPQLSSECLASVHSREEFIIFVQKHFTTMDKQLIEAIIDVVSITYSPEYQIDLNNKLLTCPISVWHAAGDGPAFIDIAAQTPMEVIFNELKVGHYEVLKSEGIAELISTGLLNRMDI